MPTEIKNPTGPEQIRQMFSLVANRYDLANAVLSFGIHNRWRKKLVQLSGAQGNMKVLDCATGTGDLAIEFKKNLGLQSEVIGCDFCAEMLASAPSKAKQENLDIHFEQGDVMALKYSDQSFAITSIAFGIRNVADPLKGLQELARVTKSGGKVMVLEFGQSHLPLFDRLYNFYSENLLPKLGGLITGQKQAYEYLQKSSLQFPCGEKFVQLMKKTGSFTSVECHSLTGGIAYIYSGTVK